jgi:type IV secretory pathway TraG/TraD family ATPase VirD4
MTDSSMADLAQPRGLSGLYLGSGARGMILAGPEQGVLVLGPPRSGKTSAVVVPNVLAAPGAVVSTSTKPDVLRATSEVRSDAGRCWLFDPSGTVDLPSGMEELHWSPLTAGATWDGALLMARAMVQAARPGVGLGEASHWNERAEALLAPLLHAAHRSGADVATVMGWVNRRQVTPALDVLGGAGTSTAADLLAGIAATDERELSGIWSTASGVLAAYRSDAALARSSRPNWDAADFVSGRDTVYVCASGRQQALVAPLVVGLLEDVRGEAYARAGRAPAGRPGPPVVLALDEVANIAPIPDLPAMVAEGGSQGLVTLACLQDLSQGRARWGDAAEGFGSLFGATVVLPGIGDVRTLRAISAVCGDVEVRVRSDTRGRTERRGRSRSVTWSTRRQPRLGIDEVAQGQPGRALVLGGGQSPAWIGLTPWWSTEPWRSLSRAAPEGVHRAADAQAQARRKAREGKPMTVTRNR